MKELYGPDKSYKNDAHAIITSHSASIIKIIDPSMVRYFQANNEECTYCSITLPDKKIKYSY